ncbi:MAG: restriction endonuclease subunit S [Gammaproteobacteria bacterium]|nr:restriction endonuclease subunit S [Gammaproteobacteria bacterium]
MGNTITCSDTTIGADTMFYQENSFIGYSHIQHLTSKTDRFNKEVANFIISSTRVATSNNKYDYGNKFNRNEMRNTKIQLPTEDGKIDFDFIERFTAQLEQGYMQKLDAYLTVTGLKDYHLTDKEKEILGQFERWEWVEFNLKALFEIATGRDVIIRDTQKGNIPLISHQHESNGVSTKIARLPNRRLFNCRDTLSVADRGVFLATTQNEDFHIGTRVKALTFKNGEKSVEIRQFIVACINKLQVLFLDYASNATDNLPNLKIQLPTLNNQPDYATMQTFISAVQKLVIKDVVLYAERKLDATRSVIN